MESFAVDRNLYEVNDVWENDDFEPISMEDSFSNSEPDWTSILDQGSMVILNDRMITDALHSPRTGVISSSDHSYSLVANESEMNLDSPLADPRGGLEDFDKDLESECFPAIPMSAASSGGVYVKQEPLSAPSSPQPDRMPQSILKQPTIILATRQPRNTPLSKMNIKVENTVPSGFSLPPTPPSSTSSDSESCLSPEHLQQPSSPPSTIRQRHQTTTSNRSSSSSHSSLISSQPKGATGSLTLTEEEKRTLVAEGYPIPNKLPLSKAEEKSLKKIRRKIKNKISAQESRRKKKEYMDALEKKVEILNSENSDYKKKLDSLQNNNKSLLSQLHKLQALIGGVPARVSRTVSTQTAASLMMVVLCFAMCVGCWGVLHLTTSHPPAVDPLAPPLCVSPIHQFYDSYATPAKRSRLLLAFLDEWESESKNSAPPKSPVIELCPTSEEDQSPCQWMVNSLSVAIKTSLKSTNASV